MAAEVEALLRDVTEILPVGVWIIGADGTILSGNAEARRIWGDVRNVGIGDYDLYKAWWHDTNKRIDARDWGVARALQRGEVSSNEIIDIESFDGQRKTIAHWSAPIRDANGRITGAIAVNQDVTARVQAERDRSKSEASFRSLFDNTPDTILVGDADVRFIDINQNGLRALGYTREEFIGKGPLDLVRPEDVPNIEPALAIVRSGQPYMREWQVRRKDGSTFYAEVYCCLMPDGRLLATLRNIDERKRAEATHRLLEAQLHQGQKMEALGTLAGGIAHDFNNILGAIIGNVELAAQDAGDRAAVQLSLAEIRRASVRARDLVRQILVFSRQQPQERKVVSLAAVVDESVTLLRATLPAGVALNVFCARDTPNVLADRTQLHQVLMNLCTNAWHAMTRHVGRIEIRAGVANVDASPAVELPPGRYALLSVQDDGHGMDAATLERIFDPFFTTKSPGDGTGLGLAVVDGIVKSHGGAIVVRSAVGVGTTFEIYLPAAAEPLSAPAHDSTLLPRGARQRILYLDDEEALVTLATRLLGRLDYDVTGCTSPAEALKIFHDNPYRFDLLVTDLNMPGKSGLDVAREVLRERPDLPVALASGYVTDTLRAQARALGIREVVYKPDTADAMAQAIHRLLAQQEHVVAEH